MKTKKLPKNIYEYVNNNTAFNMFGFINISKLKGCTNSKLSKVELIKRINNQFAKDMVNNTIQFI